MVQLLNLDNSVWFTSNYISIDVHSFYVCLMLCILHVAMTMVRYSQKHLYPYGLDVKIPSNYSLVNVFGNHFYRLFSSHDQHLQSKLCCYIHCPFKHSIAIAFLNLSSENVGSKSI